MIIKLPTVEKKMIDDKIETKRGELEVEIDTSFQAHLKWEEQFQDQLGYDLATYTGIVKGWLKEEKTAKARFVGLLKLLYCYVNSDKLPTFRDFTKLFHYEVAEEILKKLSVVLEEVGKTATKN